MIPCFVLELSLFVRFSYDVISFSESKEGVRGFQKEELFFNLLAFLNVISAHQRISITFIELNFELNPATVSFENQIQLYFNMSFE